MTRVHVPWQVEKMINISAACVLDNKHRKPPVRVAVDEAVILLSPPLPLVGVSIVLERKRQQNESLVNGKARWCPTEVVPWVSLGAGDD